MIISPDRELARQLETSVSEITGVKVCGKLAEYPQAQELLRTLRSHAPEVVFLSFENVARAQEVTRTLEVEVQGLQIIAIHTSGDAAVLRETMRVGVREFLSKPFEMQAIVDSLRHVQALIERKPPVYQNADQVIAFLPAKAGVGSTTLALNFSAALAGVAGTRVLLADFDLNSGMLRFLLKLKNEFSLVNALEHAAHLDENLWGQLVTSFEGLDILHAGAVNPNIRIEQEQIGELLRFWLRQYDAACVDLSGNLERYSLALMQEAKHIFLVCTPEIPSLHLTREKFAFLKSLDLHGRVSVILNRVPKEPLLTRDQVEEALGLPVLRSFSNDYHAVNRATAAGQFVDPKSKLGRQYVEFAQELAKARRAPAAEGKRKFLNIFSLPVREMAVHSQK